MTATGAHDPRSIVIIPTYNEADTVESIVSRVRASSPISHVLIVDDSSPDGTGEIADRLAAQDDQVRVLHRAGKEGLGRAYLAGFATALAEGFDVLVEMDADGSHDPADLPRLLAGISDHDVVIGSRWVHGGRVLNWPRHRFALSRGANTYVRLMLGLPVRDATAGYRAYRADVLRGMDLASVRSQGYSFQVDLTRRAVRAGHSVLEIPVTFTDREIGSSKMSKEIIIESLRQVTVWGLRDRLAQAGGLAIGVVRRARAAKAARSRSDDAALRAGRRAA